MTAAMRRGRMERDFMSKKLKYFELVTSLKGKKGDCKLKRQRTHASFYMKAISIVSKKCQKINSDGDIVAGIGEQTHLNCKQIYSKYSNPLIIRVL